MVEAQAIRAIKEVLIWPHHKAGNITLDSALAGDLGVDSVDLMSIACELDTVFGIDIPDSAVERWETVADVVASVERLVERSVA